jgi:demethylmenaquinone methyltransferase/2-methoxy-6-polyprenyl-1,4-benzoquinol methylase
MPEQDPATYMEQLYLTDPLQKPLFQRILEATGLSRGSCGLDAGCGVGLQIPILAEAVGPTGHVAGLDILPEFVAEAKTNLMRWGLDNRASLTRADVFDLPFRDAEFDWVWSASCACYAWDRPLELLRGFRRVLKPGGLLLIVIWSGQQLLPGYPRLEATLNATPPGLAPFRIGDPPEHHFLRLCGWMEKAGFIEAGARPFTGGVCSPLDDRTRLAVLSLIRMRWLDAARGLNRSDRRLYKRITDPSSSDFILNQPDYYGFYTYTLFSAESPE